MNSKLIGLSKVAAISLLALAALVLISGQGEVSSNEGEVQPYLPPIDERPLVIEDIPLVIEAEACSPASTSQNCQPAKRRGLFQRFFRR